MIKLMVLRNMKLKTLTIPRRNHSQTKIIHFPLKKLCKNCIILINIWLKLVSKVMLKILQARLQQQVNHEIAGVQADFRRGRGTKDQIANIFWVFEKAREFQKNTYFYFMDYAKTFDCVDHNKLENSESDGNTRQPVLPLEKSVCRSRSNCQNWT